MIFISTIVSNYPMYLSDLNDAPLAMTGLVILSERPQPPVPTLAPGQDTSEPLETAVEPDDTQAMSPRMTSEEVEALKCEMHTELHRLVKAIESPYARQEVPEGCPRMNY
jgi:hypothetical protein